MRLILTTLFALALVCAIPALADDADGIDTLGKTDAEILAMGMPDWYYWYTAQQGESTAAMSQAYSSYAAAARRRNAAMPQQADALELQRLLREFGEKSLDIAYNFSGGGTMWIPIYGQMACDVEDVTYMLLGGKLYDPEEPQMTGPVNRAVQQLDDLIEQTHGDPDATYFKYDEARTALKTVRADWQRIKALAAKLDREDSDRVLAFCHSWATAIEIGMEVC
jgi:hypothetical protein